MKFRPLLSLIACAIMSASMYAHAGVSHLYDSTQVIKGNAYVFSSDITTDTTGNVYIVGRYKGDTVSGTFYDGTTDFDPTTGIDNHTPLTSLYAGDGYVTRINADGSYGWTKTFGDSSGSAYADSVAVDSSGDIYVSGSYTGTMDFDPGAGTVLHTASAGYQRFTVKLHADGSYVWMLNGLQDDFGNNTSGSRREVGNNIKIDTNDDIYLVGYSAPGSFDFDLTAGVDTMTVSGGYAAYVSKYHDDGSYAWTRLYSTQDASDYAQINDITFDSNGNIVLLGAFDGTSSNPTVDVDPGTGSVPVSHNQTSCYVQNFVTSLDTAGNYGGWVLAMPHSYNSLALDSSNNIYMTAANQEGSQSPFNCGDYQVGGNYSAMLTKIIGHSSYAWTKRFLTIDYNVGAGMQVMIDDTDNVYVAGGSGYAGYEQATANPAYVARFTSSGSMSWLKVFGSGGLDHTVMDNDNNIYGTNPFSISADFDPSAGTDVKTPSGLVSAYLTKLAYNTANTAPVANDGSETTDQNVSVSGTLTATDAENDPLLYSIAANGSKGTATITDETTGAFTYNPASSSTGTDTFTFVANDGQLNSNAGTVTITINPAPPGTDLVITDIGNQTAADPGAYAYISNTVKNIGADVTSGTFKVALYLSTDSTITAGDTYLGDRTIFTSLQLNATSTATTGVKIPSDTPPGNYYVGAIADYENSIAETNETNNAFGVPFEVRASDLVVSSLSGPTDPAAPGDSITVTGSVSNQGHTSSSLTYLGLYFSTDSTITTGDTYLGNVLISSIAAGRSLSFSKSVKVPSGLSAGTYYLGAIADYREREAEMDETNNTRSTTFTVYVPTPDLTPSAVSVTPTSASAGTYLHLNGTVDNIGTAKAGTTTYAGFYLTDGVNDIYLKRMSVGGYLAAGSSVSSSTLYRLSSSIPPGTYTIKLVADYTDRLSEISETNNTLTGGTITILP